MNTKFTCLEERYIEHYQKKYSLSVGQLMLWLDGLRNREDVLINVEGTFSPRIAALKAEAERRYKAHKRLAQVTGENYD